MPTVIERTPEQYDFEALNFEVQLLDKHFSPLSSRTIKFVVVHHMTVVGSDTSDSALDACYNIWQSRQASAHYGAQGPRIRQYVWDKDFAWATGSNTGNLYGVSIEHANSTGSPTWRVSDLTIQTGAKLAAYLHKVYKLGRPTSNSSGTSGTLRQHESFAATACPGPYLGGTQWDAYVALVQKFYDEAMGTTPPVVIPPTVPVALWGKPETWVLGATGPDVLRLGQLINKWNAVVGLPTWTPDSTFSSTEVKALSALQSKIWGFGSTAADLAKGGNSDGYPGLQSFDKLTSTPVAPTPEVPVTTVKILAWNVAGSDTVNGYKAENSWRGVPLGEYAKSLGFDVFLACEAGQNDLRAGISKGLGITSWMARAKAIWFTPRVKQIAAREAIPADSIFSYLSTTKWGGAFYGEKDGKKFSVIIVHTDYRAPAKQAKQVQSIFRKFRAKSDALGIKHVNQFVCGDFNWDGSAGDNPFRALDSLNFEEKGDRDEPTFMERKHLDGVLAHLLAKVRVWVKSRSNGKIRLSDHNPILFHAELQ